MADPPLHAPRGANENFGPVSRRNTNAQRRGDHCVPSRRMNTAINSVEHAKYSRVQYLHQGVTFD